MASLWFGAGNNRNPLLWRRQVLYKIPNQSQPSPHGSSQQRVADVWPGICTLLDTERCKLERENEMTLKQASLLLISFTIFSNSRALSFSSCQTDEDIPVRFDERFVIWVSAEQPMKDTSFLSDKILGLCGELPIYWLQPIYPKGYPLSLLSIYCCKHWFPPSLQVYKTSLLSQRMVYSIWIIVHSFHSLFKAWLRVPCFSADTLVKCTALSQKLVKHLKHLEHSLHLEYTKKGSGLVLKKNDLEICKTAWNHCC